MTNKELFKREKRAFDLGIKAFKEGKMSVPALDKNVLNLLADLKVGECSGILDSWSEGWHKENLKIKIEGI